MTEVLGLQKNDNSIIFYRNAGKTALKMTGSKAETSSEYHLADNACGAAVVRALLFE